MSRNRIVLGTFALLLLLSPGFSSFGSTQNTRQAAQKKDVPSLLSALPPSDAVALVRVRRVLDEALPKLLAGNPVKLAETVSQIERFKTRTGLDPRSFDQVALGMKFSYPSAGITKIRTVAIAKGSFSAGALTAAGKLAANGKYEEQKYKGKAIYIFRLDQQIRVFGLADFRLAELAVSPIDSNTLVLGDVASVRGVIDLGKSRSKANAELIALASRNPNAIVGFGGNFPAELLQNLRVANDAIAKDLTAVRQMYGSVDMTEKNLELVIAARTVDEYSARNLGNTVEALKQFGGLFVGRLSGAKGVLAKSALTNLQITNQGNEVQIRTAVAQTEIAPLIGGS